MPAAIMEMQAGTTEAATPAMDTEAGMDAVDTAAATAAEGMAAAATDAEAADTKTGPSIALG